MEWSTLTGLDPEMTISLDALPLSGEQCPRALCPYNSEDGSPGTMTLMMSPTTRCIADGKQDGFFPALIDYKLQHTYSISFAVHVNLFLPFTWHLSSIIRSTCYLLRQIAHFLCSFSSFRAHSCTLNHLITVLVAHSYLTNCTITTVYA